MSDQSRDGKKKDLPSREQLCNLRPAVSQYAVSLVDDEVLLRGPRRFLHTRIEMVVPALSALLSQPAFQVLGHHRPLFVAVAVHKLYNLRNVEHASKLHPPIPANRLGESRSGLLQPLMHKLPKICYANISPPHEQSTLIVPQDRQSKEMKILHAVDVCTIYNGLSDCQPDSQVLDCLS